MRSLLLTIIIVLVGRAWSNECQSRNNGCSSCVERCRGIPGSTTGTECTSSDDGCYLCEGDKKAQEGAYRVTYGPVQWNAWYCKWCPAGKAQGLSTNAGGSESCEPCEEADLTAGTLGTYMPDEGAAACRGCEQGWYAASSESTYCTDLNECDQDHHKAKCHEHAFCNNTEGSYACICKPGYHGDGEASGLGCWGNWGVQTWDDGTNKWVTLEVSTNATDACATSGYSAISQAECFDPASSATGCTTRWDSSACLCSADVGVSVQICKVGTERQTSWKTAATYADNMLHFYKQSQNALTRMTDKMQITDSLWHKICEDAKAEAKAAISQFHDAIVKYSNSVTSFNAAMSLMKGDQTTMKGNEIKMNEAIQTWMGAQSARAQAHRRHFEFHTLLGLNFPKRQNSWRPAKDFMKKRHNIGPRVWDGTQYILPTNGHTHDIYRAIKGVKNDGETMMDGRDPNKDDVTEWWHSPDRA